MIRYQCARCGHLVNNGARSCPFCGSSGSLFPRKERSRSAAFFSVFLWLFLILACPLFLYTALLRGYRRDLQTARSMALAGGAVAHEVGEQVVAVWSHALSQVEDPETDRFTREEEGTGPFFSDPHDALFRLQEDHLFRQRMQTLADDREALALLLLRLDNPPAQYRAEYEQLCRLCGSYRDLAETILRPWDSLPSFAADFRQADEVFSRELNAPVAARPDA